MYRVLLVEDNPTDVLLLKEFFASECADYDLVHVERLDQALHAIHTHDFDLVLLDLGLPDSRGVETFLRLHESMPHVPILVLTALNDARAGLETVQHGAQDYFVKQGIKSLAFLRSVRYSIERTRAASRAEEERLESGRQRELQEVSRMLGERQTEITAQLFSASPLRETAPEEFSRVLQAYKDYLGYAIEERLFKVSHDSLETLRTFGEHLGFLRAAPKDIVEIHSIALKSHIEKATPKKAEILMEEGRLALLGLMGHLVSYYRRYCPSGRSVGQT